MWLKFSKSQQQNKKNILTEVKLFKVVFRVKVFSLSYLVFTSYQSLKNLCFKLQQTIYYFQWSLMDWLGFVSHKYIIPPIKKYRFETL